MMAFGRSSLKVSMPMVVTVWLLLLAVGDVDDDGGLPPRFAALSSLNINICITRIE